MPILADAESADVARFMRSFTKILKRSAASEVTTYLFNSFLRASASSVKKANMPPGRNSYRHSAKPAQFVIHRGLIISAMETVFSILYFVPIVLSQGWLMIGYVTTYTMVPVFSLVLDRDLNEDLALSYPELDLRHVYMIISKVVTLCIYAFSTIFLSEYFDLSFVVWFRFGWKVMVIIAVSALPSSRIAPEATTEL
ncbi:hypothetical protein BC827DRAFT_1157641 [Russula dissimulans]|nr:hypothetical protein BC827DRAFT_1157641 [Russula dissimulans]